jgi:hypothetical protein
MAKSRPHPIMLYGSQVQFNARMLATLHHRLKVYATTSGRSMSDCINDALTEFLRAHAGPDTPEEDA